MKKNRNKKILISCIIGILTMCFLISPIIFNGRVLAIDTGLETTAKSAGLSTDKVELIVLVAQIIKIVLGFLGVIFVVLVIFSGFKWMTSQGNSDEIKKARETITSAAIGVAIILAAYILTNFVFEQVRKTISVQTNIITTDVNNNQNSLDSTNTNVLNNQSRSNPEKGAY